MRRFVTACLAFLIVGAMLSTSPVGLAGVQASDKALTTAFSWDAFQLGTPLLDTHEGDSDQLAAFVFLASWGAPASGLVSPSSAHGHRHRTALSIRAPPQYL